MSADASAPWKLYHNPHFLSNSLHDSPHHAFPYESPPSSMEDLTLALAEIRELRAELELERRMRRAAESLAKSAARELADERRARAHAEAEAARCRDAVREAEEDRRMLKLAEAWREERVKMKLAHAAIVLEERMREVARNGMRKIGEVDRGVAEGNGVVGKGREVENPHIRRGMNGFVEFSRAFRVRSPGLGRERERGGGDLACERAQLRVLMK